MANKFHLSTLDAFVKDSLNLINADIEHMIQLTDHRFSTNTQKHTMVLHLQSTSRQSWRLLVSQMETRIFVARYTPVNNHRNFIVHALYANGNYSVIKVGLESPQAIRELGQEMRWPYWKKNWAANRCAECNILDASFRPSIGSSTYSYCPDSRELDESNRMGLYY